MKNFVQISYLSTFVVIALCFTLAIAQNVALDQRCLGCICEAVSGCNVNAKCDGNTCGLFRITWAYWADAGKPTQDGELPDAQNAYANCVNEPYCAARAVQGYMQRFAKQDCNGDGVIDCLDYATIHKLGGYSCPGGQISGQYAAVLQQCLIQTSKP